MNHPQIKYNDPEIDLQNPWIDDGLNRQEAANFLTNLLSKQEGSLTVCVNGAWGSGKTFMLRRWRQDLENQGFNAIYFNAWEDDFLDDPLIAIIGQLQQSLTKNQTNGFCQKLKKSILPIAMDVITSVARNRTGVDVKNITEKNWKSTSERALANYAKLIELRENLKKHLKELVDDNPVVPENSSDNHLPLFFIIDELDRCRPSFAIEVLERIKHLFQIPHIIFVLGIDRKQLGKSIQAVYGNIDVDNYLHRFIDLDFCMSQCNSEAFFNVLWKRYGIADYLREKAQQGNSNNLDINEGETFHQICQNLFLWHHFSLREIEQALKMYVLVLTTTEPHYFSWPLLAPVLIFLKIRNAELYENYLTNACTVADVVNAVIPQSQIGDDDWAYRIIPAAIYASRSSSHPQTEEEYAINSLIQDIKEQQKPSDSKYCARCLKNQSQKYYTDFVESFSQLQCGIFNQESYDPASLERLSRKIDLLMVKVRIF
ncbi:MAG: KAP family NTPase [Victivallaceae bacterium]|nr:KAP family NTPase [Victivallaceae bacterium]